MSGKHQDRQQNVGAIERRVRVLNFLKTKVWPTIPAEQLGRRLTRAEDDEILGYGAGGV